jgi:DNA-directed RNA polymerase specialized sigma24 family protein
MAGPADPGLIARAAAGDDTAFAELVGPYQRPVFRHCYRMLGSGADAEDATQDTLERAWRKLGTYDGSGPFGAWLQRIATNICLDGLRAKRARIGPGEYGPAAAPGAAPGSPDPELTWVEPVRDADLYGAGDPQDEVVRRVLLVAEDVRFSMPPLSAWFEGRSAVAAFVGDAVFAPARPHGIRLRAGSCNGQPAFATYEPDADGRLVVTGLQILQLGTFDGRPLITALVSYRNPALAIRCGLPPGGWLPM